MPSVGGTDSQVLQSLKVRETTKTDKKLQGGNCSEPLGTGQSWVRTERGSHSQSYSLKYNSFPNRAVCQIKEVTHISSTTPPMGTGSTMDLPRPGPFFAHQACHLHSTLSHKEWLCVLFLPVFQSLERICSCCLVSRLCLTLLQPHGL